MIRRFYFYIVIFLIAALVGCVSLSKFQSGEEAYERKHYSIAVKMLQKQLPKVHNPDIAQRKISLIGDAFHKMDMPQQAAKWYKKAIKTGSGFEVYYKLAKVYKKLEKYDEALNTLTNAEKKFGRSALLKKEISICKQSIRWLKNKNNNIHLKLLDINTEFSDFASDFYLDDYIVISSDRHNSSNTLYAWSGNYYFDLFISDKSGAIETNPLSGNVNTKYNEASACFNKEGDEMYFVRCGDDDGEIRNCKIYKSVLVNSEWSYGVVLPFVKKRVNYLSPWLSEDNGVLYFSSNDPKGYGGYDIYYSLRQDDGWSKPQILPKLINTVGNEKFITTWRDKIYFSSDFLPGMGGYDIFETKLDSSGRLSPPSHLDYPINSGGDDFYILKNSDSTGIVSSSRINGKGLDDIYSFEINTPRDTTTKDTLKTADKKEIFKKKIYLAIKVVENIFEDKTDPNSRILGKKPVVKAAISFQNGKYAGETPPNGFVIKEIKFDTTYNIVVGKQGYLTNAKSIKVQKDREYNQEITTLNVTVILDKIYYGREVVLKNIYYDYDKWELRDESFPTLDELYKIMKNNPGYRIKIGSHTDCRGEDDYNLELSLKRANSVVQYLLSKGINKDRLIPIGYGETRLIDKCECENCTEQQHQKNRRTTFEILK